MIQCFYVGNDCSQIGDREFDGIGQKASFSEKGFREAVLGGAAFIPAGEFERIAFDAESLAVYGPLATRVNPPSSFVTKVDQAQQVFRDIRTRMRSEGPMLEASISE